jgi:hypothetical protein
MFVGLRDASISKGQPLVDLGRTRLRSALGQTEKSRRVTGTSALLLLGAALSFLASALVFR